MNINITATLDRADKFRHTIDRAGWVHVHGAQLSLHAPPGHLDGLRALAVTLTTLLAEYDAGGSSTSDRVSNELSTRGEPTPPTTADHQRTRAGGAARGPSEPRSSWDDQVHAALAAVLAVETAMTVSDDDAYPALSHRLRQHREDTGQDPAQALRAIDPDDRAFVTRAEHPAAFLARKVEQL